MIIGSAEADVWVEVVAKLSQMVLKIQNGKYV